MQVLVVDGKNLKVGGFNYPWGEMCEKAPCSHNKNSQDEVSYILCILYFKSHLQDGVGTSPGATIKSPKTKQNIGTYCPAGDQRTSI